MRYQDWLIHHNAFVEKETPQNFLQSRSTEVTLTLPQILACRKLGQSHEFSDIVDLLPAVGTNY